MAKRLVISGAVLGALLFLPVAIGDFTSVPSTHAIPAVPEPGTLVLVTVGLIGVGISKLRRGR